MILEDLPHLIRLEAICRAYLGRQKWTIWTSKWGAGMLEVLHIPAFGGLICLTLTPWTVCSARWLVSLGRGRAKRDPMRRSDQGLIPLQPNSLSLVRMRTFSAVSGIRTWKVCVRSEVTGPSLD